MKQSDADKLLRDKLNNYASDVPTNMWDKIDAARTPQRAAIGWGKIGAATVLLTTLIVAGGLYWSSQMPTDINEQIAAQTEVTVADNTLVSDNQSTTNTAEISTEVIENTTKTAATNTETIANNVTNSNTNTIAQAKTNTANKQATNNQSNTAQVIENQEVKVNNTSAKIASNTTNTTKNTRTTTDFAPPINWDIANAATVNRAATNSAATPRPNTTIEATPIEKTTANNATDIANTNARATMGIVEPLFTLAPGLYAASTYQLPNVDCASWKGRRLFFYTDLIGSVDIPYRTFKAKNSDFNNYAHIRSSTENVSFSGSTGMRFSAVLLQKQERQAREGEAIRKSNKTGIALRTGFIYSQINEKYSRNIGTREEYTIINGDTTEISIVPINDLGNNQYRMLDIPVILGYEYDTEKYGFNVNAGAYFNLIFDPRGRYATVVGSDVQGASFTDEPQIYRDQLNMSLFASIALNYKLTPSLHLLFEPYGRYHIDPFTNSNYILEQRYMTLGIQSGLRFKF